MQRDLGSFFVIGFDGTSLPASAHKLLTTYGACGAILFKRNIETLEQVVSLNAQIVSAGQERGSPALISVDQEGGRVARLRDICTPVPTMRELAKLAQSNDELIFKTAAMMGRELASLGFHLNFAPVADVDSNKANPVIGDRAFGSDPELTGDMVARFVKGLQASGVAACAKHFPGHGDTHTDSHLELPRVDNDRARLETCELIPFRKAIAAGVASIMTAHVLLPALDDVPATLSHNILSDILRSHLGFRGLVFSDDLEMKGIANHFDLREIILRGFNAGVDVFLMCKDTDKAEEAIAQMHLLVESGEIKKERVQESLARVEAFRRTYIGAVALPSVEYAQSMVRSKVHLNLMT